MNGAYVPVDREGSQLLFQNYCRQLREQKYSSSRRTLNSQNGEGIFTDEQMAAAMIDRLVHHGHLLLFEAKSYRMMHALMRQPGPDKVKPTTHAEATTRLGEGGA